MMESVFNAYKDKHMKDVNIRSRFPVQPGCNDRGKIQCHVSHKMDTSLAVNRMRQWIRQQMEKPNQSKQL